MTMQKADWLISIGGTLFLVSLLLFFMVGAPR